MLSTNHPFWSEGLRPFFLLGALYAAISIPLWVLMVSGAVDLPLRGGLLPWHIHETLFGFAAAAVAGFLTTAVPQWTGQKPLSGGGLAVLVLLWLAGRILWLVAGLVPGWLVALVDVALLPALAAVLGAGIVGQRQWRNLPILVLVLVLAGANLMIHLAVLDAWRPGLEIGGALGLFTIVLLITIIGGRIVPVFTRNALQRAGKAADIETPPLLTIAGNLSVATAGILIVFTSAHAAAGIAALTAAALAAVRLAMWRGWSAWRMPLVWVLHLAYIWIPVGLALYGLARLGVGVPGGAAIHALAVGAAATMILAVTSRASLGHTGRPLTAPLPMVVAYVLLTVSAVARVLTALEIGAYTPMLHMSALCWSLAFLIFVVVYAPVLTRPRLSSAQ